MMPTAQTQRFAYVLGTDNVEIQYVVSARSREAQRGKRGCPWRHLRLLGGVGTLGLRSSHRRRRPPRAAFSDALDRRLAPHCPFVSFRYGQGATVARTVVWTCGIRPGGSPPSPQTIVTSVPGSA
jgi:hypothetical protein